MLAISAFPLLRRIFKGSFQRDRPHLLHFLSSNPPSSQRDRPSFVAPSLSRSLSVAFTALSLSLSRERSTTALHLCLCLTAQLGFVYNCHRIPGSVYSFHPQTWSSYGCDKDIERGSGDQLARTSIGGGEAAIDQRGGSGGVDRVKMVYRKGVRPVRTSNLRVKTVDGAGKPVTVEDKAEPGGQAEAEMQSGGRSFARERGRQSGESYAETSRGRGSDKTWSISLKRWRIGGEEMEEM
nr:hypothetical protein Iba_chr10aCG15730 [Ipomoea batatas]GMD47609.1 hypothetical protein Iba_chr10eCG14580 [Ipomoea batatas]